MRVVAGEALKELVKKGVVEGLRGEEQIQINGIELTLNSIYDFSSAGLIDFDNSMREISRAREVRFEEEVHLERGAYKVRFNEIVRIPKNMMAIARPRSSLLRCGATVETAVWDSGYQGRSEALLIVLNPHGIRLRKNARLVQLIFFELDEEAGEYSGRYQNENL
ncbi:MAG: deoxyuridine 5'-triphosphate nucleotidohydrolase [Archaeoglobi archaeon]|nr:deoxyuridine 5'-triphosphate nucleotidohydrolase [Candidatus Mnemosynella bozhongmuii]